MSLKTPSEIAEQIKIRTAELAQEQVEELKKQAYAALDEVIGSCVEIKIPDDTVNGVLTTVFDDLREAGFKLCLIERVSKDNRVLGKWIRVSVSHLLEQR